MVSHMREVFHCSHLHHSQEQTAPAGISTIVVFNRTETDSCTEVGSGEVFDEGERGSDRLARVGSGGPFKIPMTGKLRS